MSKVYDYIIIGAGIGGITYAYKNKSDNFIILEKNDYIILSECPYGDGKSTQKLLKIFK